MSAARRLTAAVLTVGTLLVLGAGPAAAEDPVDVQGPVTDRAGVLSADDLDRVETALDDYFDQTQRQIFVVLVPSFDGLTGPEWAEESALESGLGPTDLLFAVATQERAYGFSVPAEVSESDLEQVDRERVLPELRRSAWADAAVAAAEGFAEVEEGVDVPWGLVAVGVAGALGAGVYAVARSRRRYDHTHRVRDEHGQPVAPADILTDAELEQNASAALVAVDDALRTSEQELGFAEAQFGAEATTRFRAALDEGRARVREAFALRQQLDDATPETDEQRRLAASRIIEICAAVDAALDEQVDDFDRMRDIEGTAAEVLTEVAARLAAIRERLPAARETWAGLQAEHPTAVLAPAAENVAEAGALLGAAHEAVGQGRAALPGDTEAAAVSLRAAESAVAQAGALLDAVDALAASLAAGSTSAADHAARLEARTTAVATFVETHRGAVRTDARTRLSEAERLIGLARGRLDADPAAATAELERAERLLTEAQQAADADVASWRADSPHPDGERDQGIGALLLGGILVDDARRGGTTYDAGRPRRRPSSRRAAGSFGGSTRRTRSVGSGPRRRSRGGRF